ncbi:MAG: hypothetical protein FVQ81_06835, partial [Candidatus Glassbacteria bacterium]|nr:hypothetical protein [Candidatus Glassbacteria bacterium]
ALMERLGLPMASTSLGRSGEPLPADSMEFARGLYRDNSEEAPELAVIDTGLDNVQRIASTIVDMSNPAGYRLLRDGAVAAVDIEKDCGLKFIR